ncbi:hypothetical protein [Streptomyces litchfieldiae]|uniref:Uncharacterized protein n=1 Tax=Streptomyces litchfieldiae TaxID=3075543 RepID=A0ABU2MIG5_9ACTN|nr:hypothetical protein [Streptomyces sp. DSM 44938]MDT0341250.1 hypothetical protein [Streptomyces sp. DSM 44938]
MARARIVVYPPTAGGGRRVRANGEILGRARSLDELLEFLRRAGLDPDEVDLRDPELLEWRGGGPEVWV